MLASIYARIDKLLARALLAVLLAGGAGLAAAGPLYHVSVDTAGWSGAGYLSFTLTGLENPTPVTATLSNFSGSFGAFSATVGQVSGDIGSSVILAQGPSFNELLQAIDFGGAFTFDLSFALEDGLLDGSHFGVALVNGAQTGYADGTSGDIAAFSLMPGMAPALWTDARFVTVNDVPEPGSAAMVALGLLLAGWGSARARRA